jgi:hypothetical protein
MPVEQRRHQRTINNFEVILYLQNSLDQEAPEYRFTGMTQVVSPRGASVALTVHFDEPALQVDDMVRVVTDFNSLTGQINAAWEQDGRRFVGLRLLEGATWL